MANAHHPDLRPPPCQEAVVSFPTEHVMLVMIAREKKMNTTNRLLNWQLDTLFTWFDDEPSLRVAVITGQGSKAFCAGSDLLEIEAALKNTEQPWEHAQPSSASAGLARRKGKKPVLAAVNGLALGGGFEIVLNCDIAIASAKAEFGLPEPVVGVYAWSGGLPRLVRNLGMPLASDIALTGRRVSAREALDLHLITAIAKSPDAVLDETIDKAKQIAAISPDGIIVTRAALREAWETASVERAFQVTHESYYKKLVESENSKEGLAAFREKRKPAWSGSKL
ncbi:hypothetical protein LTR37_017287 [Vermiconidia calcicola]|uniref:Uncharacterized protein n=1 Tax=Vermiconidia calcicola TaxID=1690605 RepID=A0ACC3MKI1_9PEZI|nr:hypothetical protein LTR37_017287 [Vermiconidia calcicola]